MKALNTEAEIINFARELAGEGPLNESEMVNEMRVYNIFHEALSEERTWVFAYALSKNLTLSESVTDLGFKYAYVVNEEDIEDVIAVNPNTSNVDLNRVGFRRAVDYGYAIDPISESGEINADFIYVNGILHTDREVSRIIYKRVAKPSGMTAEYKLLLAYKIALHLSLTPGSDITRRDYIKSELRRLHVRAARNDAKPSSDPQTKELIAYFKANRIEAFSR